jgi:hypothetical protein
MKAKFLLALALVASGGWYCHHAQAQSASSTNAWHGFPVIPAITNANPAIRHPVSIQVPTELKIERTNDTLSATVATNRETVSIEAGTNMVVGFRSRWFAYPVGEPRPANFSDGLEGGGFVFGTGTIFLHTKPDGIPQKGKSYVVEMELSAFETDIPPQHDWRPHSKNYRVLWQRTLKQTIQ